MPTRSPLLRHNELINQLVLDRNTLEELGRVEVLWTYPQSHRVLGFIAKSGFLGSKKAAFNLGQIHAFGENGVLTHSQPEPTNAEKVSQLETLLQHEVWSDAGNRIGKITDFVFDLHTGAITHYLFTSNGWSGITGEQYQLAPSQILSFGKKRVLVPEAAIAHFELYREGLQQKFSKARTFITEEASQEWRSLSLQAKTVAERAREQLLHISEQAKERSESLSEQAKERAKTLNEQLKERTQVWIERAKETSETVAEQIKERTHTVSKQVEDQLETLTIQAEEIFDWKDDAIEPPPSQSNNQPQSSNQTEDLFDWDDETVEPPPSPERQTPSPQRKDVKVETAIDDDDEPWI